MKKGIIHFLFLICLSAAINLATVTAWAEETPWGDDINLSLGLQSGRIKGHTTYRISFSGGESELEFPLSNSLLGIQIGLSLRNSDTEQHDKARLTLKWFTNMSDKAGQMKDSDWIEDDEEFLAYYGLPGYHHSGKDIYSESDAELEANKTNIIDLNYIWDFFPTKDITLGVLLGYRYQKFDYDINDVEQVGYGPYAPYFTGPESGLVLKYKVIYKFTYIGLNTDILLGEHFLLNLQTGYSGTVKAKDEDDHILRNKVSKGNCDGNAFLVNINANWELSDNWSFQISGEYVDINTKGKQNQYWYGDDPASPGYDDTGDAITGIPDKITSSFRIVSIGIKYRF